MGRTTKLSIPSGTITESTGVGVPLGWHDCGYDRNVIMSSSSALPRVPLVDWFGSEFNYSQLQNSYQGWPASASSATWTFSHAYADYDLGKIFVMVTTVISGTTYYVGFLQFDIATQVWTQLYCISGGTSTFPYTLNSNFGQAQIEDIKLVGGEYRALISNGGNGMQCMGLNNGTVYISQSASIYCTVETLVLSTNSRWHGRLSDDGATIYLVAAMTGPTSLYGVGVAYGTKAYNDNTRTFTIAGGVANTGTAAGNVLMDSRRKVLKHKNSAVDMHVFCYAQTNSNVPVGMAGVLYTSKVWVLGWQDNGAALTTVASIGNLVAYGSNAKYSGAHNLISSSPLQRNNYLGTANDSLASPEGRFAGETGAGGDLLFLDGVLNLVSVTAGAYLYTSHVLINNFMSKIDLAISGQALTLTGTQTIGATYQQNVDDNTEQIITVSQNGAGSAGTLRMCKFYASTTHRVAPIKSGYMVKL